MGTHRSGSLDHVGRDGSQHKGVACGDSIQLRAKQKQEHREDPGAEASDDEALSWKDQLIARLLQVSPEGLAQRLLREAGFVNVTVLGKSGAGGIDGVGVYRLSRICLPHFRAR